MDSYVTGKRVTCEIGSSLYRAQHHKFSSCMISAYSFGGKERCLQGFVGETR